MLLLFRYRLFKSINDNFGHIVGDKYYRHLADFYSLNFGSMMW